MPKSKPSVPAAIDLDDLSISGVDMKEQEQQKCSHPHPHTQRLTAVTHAGKPIASKHTLGRLLFQQYWCLPLESGINIFIFLLIMGVWFIGLFWVLLWTDAPPNSVIILTSFAGNFFGLIWWFSLKLDILTLLLKSPACLFSVIHFLIVAWAFCLMLNFDKRSWCTIPMAIAGPAAAFTDAAPTKFRKYAWVLFLLASGGWGFILLGVHLDLLIGLEVQELSFFGLTYDSMTIAEQSMITLLLLCANNARISIRAPDNLLYLQAKLKVVDINTSNETSNDAETGQNESNI